MRTGQQKLFQKERKVMRYKAHAIRDSCLFDRMTCVPCELTIKIVLDTDKFICFIFYVISLQRNV
jgi:hypothetical protein